ncbi:MAG: hypothetical protein R3F11_06275 [Verrucomicrobiales bacterium]
MVQSRFTLILYGDYLWATPHDRRYRGGSRRLWDAFGLALEVHTS